MRQNFPKIGPTIFNKDRDYFYIRKNQILTNINNVVTSVLIPLFIVSLHRNPIPELVIN